MPKPKKRHGGSRQGAGRPPGAESALEHGAVKALKAVRLRVPEGADPDAAELADEALGTIVDVMRGDNESFLRLKAATLIRAEVCGPLTQRVEHAGADGGPIQVVIQKLGAGSEDED